MHLQFRLPWWGVLWKLLFLLLLGCSAWAQSPSLSDSKGQLRCSTDGYRIFQPDGSVLLGMAYRPANAKGIIIPNPASKSAFYVLQLDSLTGTIYQVAQLALANDSLQILQGWVPAVQFPVQFAITADAKGRAQVQLKETASEEIVAVRLPDGFRLPAAVTQSFAVSPSTSLQSPSLLADTARGTTWLFGYNAGLRFTVGSVQPIGGNALHQLEGTAVLQDSTGNLLAYTDGSTLYDSQHHEVAGNLGGHPSSTQGALFIPIPAQHNAYLLAVIDQGGYAGSNRGLTVYHLLITPQGALQLSPQPILQQPDMTEKLAAVYHANGRDIWLVAHRRFSNHFMAWPVTASGLGHPVESAVGAMHSGFGDGTIGQMVISPRGDQLAVAVTGLGRIERFRFDSATGQVSAAQTVSDWRCDSTALQFPYGMAFSADGRQLFASDWRQNRLDVWTVEDDSLRTAQSRVSLQGTDSTLATGALQLGPDGHIYVAMNDGPAGIGAPWIGRVVKTGNGFRFSDRAVELPQGSRSAFGLPNAIAGMYSSLLVDFAALNSCAGQLFQLQNRTRQRTEVRWTWALRNTSGEWVPFSTEENPSVTWEAGTYSVLLKGCRGNVCDSLERTVRISAPALVKLGADTTLPADGTALHLRATADTSALCIWSTGATAQVIDIQVPGQYWVQVYNGSCLTSDTIRVWPQPATMALANAADSAAAAQASSTLAVPTAEPSVLPRISILMSLSWLPLAPLPQANSGAQEGIPIPTVQQSQPPAFQWGPQAVVGFRYRLIK